MLLRGGSKAFSKAMGMSLRTLRRHFERKGTSLFAFRQARRASLTVNLLQRPEIRLRDLVARIGFSNPASLARFVHNEFGMTPGELRRQLRPDGPPRASRNQRAERPIALKLKEHSPR
jgi:AraC-like DNA-binding protein